MVLIFIYQPPASPPGATSRNPNDPCLIGKGLLLEGSTPKTKTKQVSGRLILGEVGVV